MAPAEKSPTGRRSEIIDTARHLFQTREYDKTTMHDVMELLGIAKGTIYHYFKSKEALFEAVIEDMADANIEHMRVLLRNSNGTVLEKIQLLIVAGDISVDNPGILENLHRPGNSAIHVSLLAATIIKQAPLYAELIQQGCE